MASETPPPTIPDLRAQQVSHGHLHDSTWPHTLSDPVHCQT